MWRVPEISGLEVLHASYVTHAFARHTHGEFAVGLIDAGVERFEYRGATHTAPAASTIVLNPEEVHTGTAASDQGWAMRMLYVDPELLRGAAGEVAGRIRDVPFFGEAVLADVHLAGFLNALHVALVGPATALEREMRLLWALAYLLRRHADDPPRDRPVPRASAAVQRAREYLDAHSARNVSLRELAHIAALSPYHLARAFRREIGLPPHLYLEQRRASHAKRLLLGSAPLSHVAMDVGFADQSHFTKRFKRFVGVTPRQYRLGARGAGTQDAVRGNDGTR